MILPRSAELQWQKEIIKLWLITGSIPPDARAELIELLRAVEKEMEELRSGDQNTLYCQQAGQDQLGGVGEWGRLSAPAQGCCVSD